MYLDLATTVLDRFRPEILLTYGGHPVSRSLMLKARARGTAVVFHSAQLRLQRSCGSEDVDAIIFPSDIRGDSTLAGSESTGLSLLTRFGSRR